MFGPKQMVNYYLLYFKIIARCVSFHVVSIKMNDSYDIHSENYYEKAVPQSRSGKEYECIRKNIPYVDLQKKICLCFYQTI